MKSAIDHLSSLPLSSLSAICLDTETTGLDTKTARIVQIGAVKISKGTIDEKSVFDEFVNPGQPIPEESTRIHGIYDKDVVGAENFCTVFNKFSKWSEEEFILGYSIGFDYAILQAEHQRAGQTWQAPRNIDVRHLVALVLPNAAQQSLEAAANYLGIKVVNRHTALGDAKLAAEVFQTLIPELHKANISTTAQAERACLGLLAQQEMESRAGWHNTNDNIHSADQAVGSITRIDSYLFRNKARDIMHTPPIVIEGAATSKDALTLLIEKKVSSAFVTSTDAPNRFGIVTERDILRKINDDPTGALNAKVGEIASFPLVTINQEEYAYRAINVMTSRSFRHLAVTDNDGNLIGALSARDLLKQRAADAILLGDNVERANSAAELGTIWRDLTPVVNSLVTDQVDARDIAAIISRELRALTKRACEIAEQSMLDSGKGPPPCDYAMLVLGSGGRGESLLAMDQDNAIVYADSNEDPSHDLWFAELGEKVADILDSVGVEYCKGGVMAKNAEWRMSSSKWTAMIAKWIHGASPQDILNADIFFDCTAVHGNEKLCEGIRLNAIRIASNSSEFINLLSLGTADFKIPLTWLGGFKTENGRVDLKLSGIMPIFSVARVLALKHGITENATPGRLNAVRDKLERGDHIVPNLIQAHRLLLDLILKQQLRDIEDGLKLSNRVAVAKLASNEKNSLKWAINQVRGIPDLLGKPADIW